MTVKPKTTLTVEDIFTGSEFNYVDKDKFVEDETVFGIDAIDFQPKQGFEGSDRWLVTINVLGDIYHLTLQSNPKRDEQMELAQQAFEQGLLGNALFVLTKSGRAHYIKSATT